MARRSLLNGGPGVDSSGIGRAAVLITHPLRLWAVEHAMRQDTVTTRDVEREFPAFSRVRCHQHIKALVDAGWLRALPVAPQRDARVEYVPGDIQDLHELHTYLTELLAFSPTEVTHEAHE